MWPSPSKAKEKKHQLIEDYWKATAPTPAESAKCRELEAILAREDSEIPDGAVVNGDKARSHLRLVRARQGNVKEAAQMARDLRKWRADNAVDSVLNEPLGPSPRDANLAKEAVIRACLPSGVHGYDKQGRPLFIERVGRLRFDAMTEKGVTTQDFVRHHVQIQEYMNTVCFGDASRVAGFTVDKFVYVMDMKGLSLSVLNSATFGAFKEVARIDQNYYPETLGAMLIVNAPTVFSVFWSLSKPLINPNTRAKIKIVRAEKTRETLLQYVDEAHLPKDLGGTFQGDATSSEVFGHVTAFHRGFDEEVRRRGAAANWRKLAPARAKAPAAAGRRPTKAVDKARRAPALAPAPAEPSEPAPTPKALAPAAPARAAKPSAAEALMRKASAGEAVPARHIVSTFLAGVVAGALAATAVGGVAPSVL